MKQSIIFDSLKHIRKAKTRCLVLSPNGNNIYEKNIEFNRVVVRRTEHYNRIDIHMTEDTTIADFQETLSEYYKAKDEIDYNSYLSLTIYPNENNKDDSVIYFISTGNISYFDSYETKSGEKIYTAFADGESYCIINGEKTRDGIYDELVKTENKANDEEEKFIEETMILQTDPAWFPDAKQAKEHKKKMEKKKENSKMEGVFGVKKKKKQENTQEPIRGEQGEFINPKSLKTHIGSSNPDYELENIIGLANIKKDIKKMQAMLEYEASRQSRGISTHDVSSMHMCFMGHPGTGKTTIARIMTGILYSMNYVEKNQCIEISGLDLKGGYVGQTAIITKQIVDMARGGVLFIDEAYALCEERGNSFGKEAISVLLKEMEDNRGDLIVIFAGYEEDMNKFLNVNPGFRSRINKYFDFLDYTTIELGQILMNYIKRMHLKITKDALTSCIELFNQAKKHPNFSNARFVRNLTEQVEEQHILNSVDDPDIERMDIITKEDIPETLIEKMLYGM